MKLAFSKNQWWVAALLLALAQPGQAQPSKPEAQGGGAPAFAIPTFHCLGLYWSPPGGAGDKEVKVRYRRPGAAEWKDGLPMRYNPIPNTDEDLTDYRGSLVHLAPATTYEIQLALAGTSTITNLTATTWSEDFPVGETVRVGDRGTPLAVTDSGTPKAWRVYDGRGATIDVRHQHDACVTVNASNVILRGFTLKGAGATNLRLPDLAQIDLRPGCRAALKTKWIRFSLANHPDSGSVGAKPAAGDTAASPSTSS